MNALSNTQTYFRRFPKAIHREFGRTGRQASFVGFGSYRVSYRNPEHREALKLALDSGCNLIDTSPNYSNGEAEQLIGDVLSTCFSENSHQRDELIVITKAGYVQGKDLDLARERSAAGNPIPEMVQFAPDCWHCISPEFLELQLTSSLERLKLSASDVFLLHNPEQFLEIGGAHAEYYARIRRAFAHLEREVARGRIQYYGISSNGLPAEKTSAHFTSLEILLEIAGQVSPDHHFAVVQFPFNLYESGAALELNNSGKSVLEVAARANLAVLINRPFNSFPKQAEHGKLLRLTEPAGGALDSETLERVAEEFQTSLSNLLQLEAAYPEQEVVPAKELSWGHILRNQLPQFTSQEAWERSLTLRIRPALENSLNKLSSSSEPESWPEKQLWIDEYRFRVEELFDLVPLFLRAQQSVISNQLNQNLIEICPELATSQTLSQKVLRIYSSIPGIQTVLAGIRTPAYVHDALSPLETLAPATAIRILKNFELDPMS